MKRIRLKELAECLECTIGLVSNWENGRGRTWNETFGYDGMGNITSINRNGVSSTYTYDKLNRIDVETVPGLVKNYDYDSRGNIQLIQLNGISYANTYDSADRLQSANTPNGPISYTYDNRGTG